MIFDRKKILQKKNISSHSCLVIRSWLQVHDNRAHYLLLDCEEEYGTFHP